MHELIRLRHRFMLILLCSVGLVLTVALVVSVASGFSTQLSRIQNSLAQAQAIERGDDLRPRIGGIEDEALLGSAGSGTNQGNTSQDDSGQDGANPDANQRFEDGPRQGFVDLVPVYVVDLSGSSGQITSYGNAAVMDEETLQEALSRITSESDSSGVFLDLGLFYSRQTLDLGAERIAFADATQLYNSTLSQSLIALLVWVFAMVAFFVLSRVLSRMVLKPVEVAWSKQRQFIADASHEIKTPLTIILANNNIMLSHPEKTTAEQQQWLESTEEEANRMNNLVTDLLLLAQVENTQSLTGKAAPSTVNDAAVTEGSFSSSGGFNSSGSSKNSNYLASARKAPSGAPIDLSALVERSLLQFDAVFFERGITSEFQIEKGLQSRGNKEHLRRLIDILLDNASKYGNKGGSVTICLARSADQPDSALLSVSNSGALIPPKHIDQVFERFYRVDTAHSNAVDGSGLGLALAKEIVCAQGGSIQVSSTPLTTSPSVSSDLALTTFCVVLPLSAEKLSA